MTSLLLHKLMYYARILASPPSPLCCVHTKSMAPKTKVIGDTLFCANTGVCAIAGFADPGVRNFNLFISGSAQWKKTSGDILDKSRRRFWRWTWVNPTGSPSYFHHTRPLIQQVRQILVLRTFHIRKGWAWLVFLILTWLDWSQKKRWGKKDSFIMPEIRVSGFAFI